MSDQCDNCNGSGEIDCYKCVMGSIKCPTCGGTGFISHNTCHKCEGFGEVDCPYCDGNGLITCDVCGGDGL